VNVPINLIAIEDLTKKLPDHGNANAMKHTGKRSIVAYLAKCSESSGFQKISMEVAQKTIGASIKSPNAALR
jgi:hypothetical protein